MNNKFIPLVLVAAFASAQSAPAVTLPNLSAGRPVAAPNKTLFRAADAARSGGHDDYRQDGKEVRPLVLADSQGQTLGPFAGELTVLLPYKKEFAAVRLGPDYGADSQPVSGGFNWDPEGFFYTSTDCSGQPYGYTIPTGTRYIGWATLENGKFYIYVIDTLMGREKIAYNSIFAGRSGVCSRYTGTAEVRPVLDSIPAESLGKAPFFLKYAP